MLHHVWIAQPILNPSLKCIHCLKKKPGMFNLPKSDYVKGRPLLLIKIVSKGMEKWYHFNDLVSTMKMLQEKLTQNKNLILTNSNERR